jgi:hypothetical protein
MMDDQHFALLKKVLQDDFVQHLPPLLNAGKSAEQQQEKNLSRAFSAFALSSICHVPVSESAKAVIDDFDDYGVDAIFLHSATDTLYLVQAKLKASSQFKQDEALSFCHGIRRLVNQDLDNFNQHLQARRTEIEDAITDCSHIRIVVAHTGEGISLHAKKAIDDLLSGEDHDEERFDKDFEDFDQAKALEALLKTKAVGKINAKLSLQECGKFCEPHLTYFGLARVDDLVALHTAHGSTLYDRNIRSFLGLRTPINQAIRETLRTQPELFAHLNNGVTMLAEIIEFRGAKKEKKTLNLRGISVVNGAQTIATSARFKDEHKAHDTSAAKVLLTIIKASPSSDLGKQITRARNHQNPVESWNFAALDDLQEVLRCELAVLGLHYIYKAAAFEGPPDPSRIHIAEAAQALAMLQSNARFPVVVKKSPADLLDTRDPLYSSLFRKGLTGMSLANAVIVNRYIQKQMAIGASQSRDFERLVSMHGNHAAAWVLIKRTTKAIESPKLIDATKLSVELGKPLDDLRQLLEDETRKLRPIGPLSVFRNLGSALPVLREVSIRAYQLSTDPVVAQKRTQQRTVQELFDYVVSQAPQIGNLA